MEVSYQENQSVAFFPLRSNHVHLVLRSRDALRGILPKPAAPRPASMLRVLHSIYTFLQEKQLSPLAY